MNRIAINRAPSILPLVLSGVAFTIVMTNIVAGVPPQPDENASAHAWQLLMTAQLPLIPLFVATAEWRRRQAAIVLAAQFFGIAIACLPVWLAGY